MFASRRRSQEPIGTFRSVPTFQCQLPSCQPMIANGCGSPNATRSSSSSSRASRSSVILSGGGRVSVACAVRSTSTFCHPTGVAMPKPRFPPQILCGVTASGGHFDEGLHVHLGTQVDVERDPAAQREGEGRPALGRALIVVLVSER